MARGRGVGEGYDLAGEGVEYAASGYALLKLFTKFTSAYLFQIAQEKSCDYLLIICMKKYEIAYDYAEAKRAH